MLTRRAGRDRLAIVRPAFGTIGGGHTLPKIFARFWRLQCQVSALPRRRFPTDLSA